MKQDTHEDVQFLARIGQTLIAWGFIEHQLCRLLTISLRHSDWDHVAEVYYAVTNFRDRLGMVNAAVSVAIANKSVLAEWARLHVAVGKCGTARNKVAHGSLSIETLKSGTQRHSLGPHMLHLSAYREALRRPQKHFLTTRRLARTSESFFTMREELSAFCDGVEKLLKPLK